MILVRKLAVLIVVFGSVSVAQANIIIASNDDLLTSYQSADGMNISTDTLTGLDWLDVTTTTGYSFYEMSGMLGIGKGVAVPRIAILVHNDIHICLASSATCIPVGLQHKLRSPKRLE